MLRYYKRPDLTEKVLIDGWFYTGDIGKIDELGRIYITGRKKNLIVLNNGKNIYPEEIESYFDENPIISEIIVYAKNDADGSSVAITAEIFPAPEYSENKSKEEIEAGVKAEIDAVNARLPMYKQIKKITIRDTEFEKTTMKKIKRNQQNQN